MIADVLYNELRGKGADLIGCGDLSAIPPDLRYNLPVGVSVAVKYPKEVIQGIENHPTPEYYAEYSRLNALLDSIVTHGAQVLRDNGYRAVARTLDEVGKQQTEYASTLPHKTVATRARIGWIGRCALLVTEKYGSMIRISSIITDAPLPTAKPIVGSKCGNCTSCRKNCPAQAIKGARWTVETPREALVDVAACCEMARGLSEKYVGERATICGRCIVSCPYTQRYLHAE